MPVVINGTSGIVNNATDLNYTGTLTGGTGVVNLGSGQVYKDASGNVGIGTSSPTAKLHVNQSKSGVGIESYDLVRLSLSGTPAVGDSTNIVWYSGSIKTAGISGITGGDATAYGSLAFSVRRYTTDTYDEVGRFDNRGNLLVGSTSNGSSARIFAQATNGGNGLAITNTSGTALYNAAVFYNNGTSFTNTGAIAVSGTTTSYNTSSDYRLKEAIAPMTGALAKIALLKPVTYKWKVDGSDGEGFIAHELQAVIPDCVTGEKDAINEDGSIKPQGIDTSFLVATLTAAIQEQQALITALTARITALEGTP